MYLLIRLFQIDTLSNDILVRPRRLVHALHVTLENCLKSLATPLLIFTNSCHVSSSAQSKKLRYISCL